MKFGDRILQFLAFSELIKQALVVIGEYLLNRSSCPTDNERCGPAFIPAQWTPDGDLRLTGPGHWLSRVPGS